MMKMFLMMRGSVFCSLLAGLFLLIGLGGCGYKNDPVAPQALVPEPINDLRYEIAEQEVVLRWSYPTRTVSGEDITEIDSFLLYRAEVPTDAYCDTCPVPFGEPIKLAGGNIPEQEGVKKAKYEVTLLRPAHKYFFKIRSRTGWLTPSSDSNQVTFIWQTPPAAPDGLVAEVDDSSIILRWQPVASHLDGTSISRPVMYQVSRRLGKASFKNVGSLLTATEYMDTEVTSGNEYTYRVQAFAMYEDDMVASGFSTALEMSVLDQTAPSPPENVKTARTATAVKIFWDQGTEKDLAGYRIYRRLGNETVPQMIGVVEVPYNIYEDLDAPEKDVYVYYSVTSFDKSDPPNESGHSAEADVR